MRLLADPRTVKTFLTEAFLYAENGQKIKGYIAQITWAMDVFHVS